MSNQFRRPERIDRFVLRGNSDIELWANRGPRRLQGTDIAAVGIGESHRGVVELVVTASSGEQYILSRLSCKAIAALLGRTTVAAVDPALRYALSAAQEPRSPVDPASEVLKPVTPPEAWAYGGMALFGLFFISQGLTSSAHAIGVVFGIAWTAMVCASAYNAWSLRYSFDSRHFGMRSLFSNQAIRLDEVVVITDRVRREWGGRGPMTPQMSVLSICGDEIPISLVKGNSALIKEVIRLCRNAKLDPAIADKIDEWSAQ